jgi:predicted transcriptional regulator
MARTPSSDRLSRREREIMNALFALGNRASADDIRQRLTDPPSYSAVRAMLVRLEAKGHIRHSEQDGRYIYAAKRSRATAGRAALRQYLGVFFGGSISDMMASLLRQQSWTDAELDALQDEIERARRERKR